MRYGRIMRTLRIITALLVAAALAACSPADEEEFGVQDYYDTIRGIEGFENISTSELDEFAVDACEAMDRVVAEGASNEDAVELVYQTFVGVGASEAEALMASIALIGVHCPIDISK